MDRANKEVRNTINKAGLKHWQVAQQLDIHPSTLTVWLRTPLTEERQKQINEAVEHVSNGSTK